MSTPVNAPACFASASIHSSDSEVCRGCVVFVECSVASLETLEAIKSVINVRDLLNSHAQNRKLRITPTIIGDELIENKLPAVQVERKTKIIKMELTITEEDGVLVARLPVKPQMLARRLCETGYISLIRKDLRENRNTFAESGPAFMRIAVDMLLAGGGTKRLLKARLMEELAWSEGTAGSHVAIFCALAVGMNLAEFDGETLVVSPALK